MYQDEYVNEKKKQKNLFGFLQKGNNNGKQHHQINHKKETMITQGIFGVPLKAASACGSCTDIGLTIPDPVYKCFEEIRKRGLFTEGIFRLSGGAAEIEQLITSFDTPPSYGRYLDLSHYDIHAITCVVKKYLRQLPEPAIPLQYHEKFMQLYDEGLQIDLTTKTLGCLLQQLPKEHFHLIYYIMLLCSDILKHADKNMMNSEALAVVFAPVCTGFEQQLKGSSTAMSAPSSWLNKRRHSPAPMTKTCSTSSSSTNTTTTTSTTTSSSSLGAAKLLMINYNNETMSQCMEINAKWTRIWALMIEYNDRLLQLWKDTPLYDDYYPPSTIYSSNSGHGSTHDNSPSATTFASSHTMPCLSPTQQHFPITPPYHNTTARMDHSIVGLHPASIVTMTTSMKERGGDVSPPVSSDDLLLDIAPALVMAGGKKATKKRHSLNNSNIDDDIYKVVVMRRPRQNSCSRAIFDLDNSESGFKHCSPLKDNQMAFVDDHGFIHQQSYGPPPPVPPHTRTSSIANILRNSKRSLSRATGATATTTTIIVQPQ